MKAIVFAYHEMGIVGLEALKRAGFEIQAILTHKADPEENCWFSSVTDWAKRNNIDAFCPENVNCSDWVSRLQQIGSDVIFSFYYRNLLSETILQIPPAGAYNLHGSLLPAYRGRAPVNWVIINGERETGVSLHHMVAKADAGDIVGQKSIPIVFEDTALTLFQKLLKAADQLLKEALPLIKEGYAPRIPQDPSKVSYYGKRRPEDGKINWRWTSERIYNLVRGVTKPYPGAFTLLPDSRKMIIWWALPEKELTDSKAPCGTLRSRNGHTSIKTGDGWIQLLDIEIAGQRAIDKGIAQLFHEEVILK